LILLVEIDFLFPPSNRKTQHETTGQVLKKCIHKSHIGYRGTGGAKMARGGGMGDRGPMCT